MTRKTTKTCPKCEGGIMDRVGVNWVCRNCYVEIKVRARTSPKAKARQEYFAEQGAKEGLTADEWFRKELAKYGA